MNDTESFVSTLGNIVDTQQQATDGALDRSAAVAVRANPDEFARYNSLAQKTGRDPLQMLHNPEIAKQAEQDAKRAVFSDLGDRPVTKDFLGDPKNATLAQDSTEDMTTLEALLRPAWRTTRAIAGGVAGFAAPVYGVLETGSKLIDEAVAKGHSLATGEPVTPGFVSPVSAFLENARKLAEQGADTITGAQPTDTVGGAISSGAKSFGQMAPAMVGAILAPEIALPMLLGSAGVMAGGASATKSLDKGKSALSSALYGAEDAFAEVATEMIPMGRLIKDLKAGAPFFKMLGANIAREVPTEMAATAWQNFNEWANLNPDKPFSTYLEALPMAEAQTIIATITMSTMSVGMMKGLGKIASTADNKQPEGYAAQLVEAMKVVAQSKLKTRDAATMQSFLQSVIGANDGQPSTVFISPAALEETFTQSGVSMDALPSVAAQIEEAKALNVDLEIPTAELITAVAGTGAEQTVVQHIREDRESPTLAEAQAYQQKAAEMFGKAADTAAAEAEPVLSRAEWEAQQAQAPAENVPAQPAEGTTIAPEAQPATEGRTAPASAAKVPSAQPQTYEDYLRSHPNKQGALASDISTVYDDILEQLGGTGLVARSVQSVNALLATNLIATNAARMGVLPSEFWKEHKLNIQAEQFSREAEDTLNQDSAKFRAWFGDSKVVNPDGSPMVVYHGTKRAPDTFTKSRTGSASTIFGSYEVERYGIFAAESADLAEEYANQGDRPTDQTLMPLYMRIENPLDTVDGAYTNEVWDRIEKAAEEMGAENPYRVARMLGDAWGSGDVWQLFDSDGEVNDAAWWVDLFKKAGYDGLRIQERSEGDVQNTASWMAFDPEQVKSAVGNDGEYNPNDPNILHQSVSTRTPTPKAGRPDPHLKGDLAVEISALDSAPVFKEKLAGIVSKYVVTPRTEGDIDTKIEQFISQAESNLLWLYDQIPPEVRERSKLWYVGGREIVDRWVDKYKGRYSDAQMAAALAAMSPKMAWDTNVSLSERIVDIFTNHQNTPWSGKMTKVLNKIAEKNANRVASLESIKGKKLHEISSPLLQGMWIRIYDEANNPRSYRLLTPEGGFLPEFAKVGSGKEAVAAYGNGFEPIAKVVSVLRDGSMENISRNMGDAHKVRNFYNNIFDPSDPKSVTIDTHAVAAALLLPLGASSAEVHDALSGPSHGASGTGGTYVLYAEAYRRAAAARGVLPREMQSITWEAGRGLFSPAFKTAYAKKPEGLKAAWQDYTSGKATLDETRQKISDLAGGIEHPRWVGSRPGLHEGAWASSYSSDILGPRRSGRALGRGARSYFASGVPDGAHVTFEVAPNPDDANLTGRWESLPLDVRESITSTVGYDIASRAVSAFPSLSGHLVEQLGGFEDTVNTSLTIEVPAKAPMRDVTDMTRVLGYALRQKSMMETSPEPFEGGDEMGVVTIHLDNLADAKYIGDLYFELRDAVRGPAGEILIGGHTTANGKMAVLVPLEQAEDIHNRVADYLGDRHDVSHGSVFVSWPEKGEDDYGFAGQTTTGTRPSLRKTADSLRAEADRQLEAAIAGYEQGDQAGAYNQGGFPEYLKPMVRGWRAVASDFSSFQYPLSPSKDLATIGEEILPGMKTHEVGWLSADTGEEGQGFNLVMEDSSHAFVMKSKDGYVWINVANLKPGKSRGSAVYATVANWAYNNGYKFIGDPAGVSVVGQERRLENMISAALKVNSTRHLAPSVEQLERFAELPSVKESGLQWQDGKDANNLAWMMLASYDLTVAKYPEVKDARFNIYSGRFEWKGKRPPVSGVAEILATTPGLGDETLPTSTTFRRAVLTQSLLHGEGSKTGEDVLGGLREFVQSGGVATSHIGGSLYQGSEGSASGNLGFYSALLRGVEDHQQGKGTPEQWTGILKNLKGVKADEIEQSGVVEWLGSQPGSVTRQQIVDFLKAGGIQLEETILSAGTPTALDWSTATEGETADGDRRWDMFEEVEGGDMRYSIIEIGGRYYAETEVSPPGGRSVNRDIGWKNTFEGAAALLETQRVAVPSTEYHGYKTPGGSNYKELLLRLPTQADKIERLQVVDRERDRYGRGIFDVVRPDGTIAATFDNWSDASGYAYDATQTAQIESNRAVFNSPHWGGKHKNVLAHIRFDERVDQEGNRVLHIAEVQSDWAQKGRSQGFGSSTAYEIHVPGRRFHDVAATRAEADAMAREQGGVVVEKQTEFKGVPSAPFVTSTSAWTLLAMKRAIRYAAENGFQSVTWDNGKTQADRYSLRKQVSKLGYWKNEDGTYRVSAEKVGGGGVTLGERIREAELSDHVGKEVANKIVNGDGVRKNYASATSDSVPWMELTGLDLEVGGEGMVGYYDKILPAEMNKYLKKWGIKVGLQPLVINTDAKQAAADDALLQELGATPPAAGTPTVMGFPITPQMRDDVMGGQPLFQKERASFRPLDNTMLLGPNSDLTSFSHELAHYSLEMLAKMALSPNAPQEVVDDFNTTLKWFGIPDRNTWDAMSLEEKRPYHEQWAESNELFLLEGNAPSAEMQPIFSRIRAWMISVYKSLEEFVKAHPAAGKLNDEVRGVFSRLMASEDAILQMQQVRGYEMLFKTAEEAGVDSEAFAEYLKEHNEATDEAIRVMAARSVRDMKWLTGARNKVIKAMQKEAAATRKEMHDRILAEVMQEPVEKARKFLKTGETVDPNTGDEIKVEKGFKLNTDMLKAMYPESGLSGVDLSKLKGLTSPGGLDPELVAQMFGFQSGDALVRELVDGESLAAKVEGKTDARMIEEHGDLIDAQAVNRAADQAIHNEARARFMATGLSILTKNQVPARVLNAAAKKTAEDTIAKKLVKDVKPLQYTAAETRANKEATKLAPTDPQGAIKAQRTALLNNRMARAAQEAVDEIRTAKQRFAKMLTGKDADIAKRRDMELVKAVRAVLAAYGIGTKGAEAEAYLATAEEHNPGLYAAVKDLVDGAIASAKPFEKLTVEEMRGLRDTVEGIWFLSRRGKQVEIDGRVLDTAAVAAELRAKLEENGVPEGQPGRDRAITEKEHMLSSLASAVAAFTRVEAWVRLQDMGESMGPFRRYIFQPVKDAADKYRTEKANYLRRYRALLDGIAPTLKAQKIAAPEIGYTFGYSKGGMGKAELLHAILHTGNESNKRKLLLGRGWATETQDGKLDTRKWDAFITRMHKEGVLTKADYDFAQGVWDLLESMKPLAQKTHRQVFGRYFDEVTANEVVTPFGSYRGGYVPAIVDSGIVHDAAVRNLAEDENDSLQFAFPSAPKGFTNARVASYNRELLLDLRTLSQHIDKVLLFSYMEAPVRDVRRILTHKDLSPVLTKTSPQAFGGMLTPWLSRAAKQQVETPVSGAGRSMKFFTAIRNNAGLSAMAANIANAVQQVTGMTTALTRVSPSHMLHAVTYVISDPRGTYDAVAEMSPYMATRMENEVHSLSADINDILLNPGVYESVQNWSSRHAYFLQSAVDNVLSPVIWIAAYNEALEKGSPEADAIRLADSVVRETQGSNLPEDLARFEASNAFVRLFTQFAGFFNTQANLLGSEFLKITRGIGLRKGAGRGLYLLLFGFLAPAWVGEAVMQAFRGGPDDEDKDGEYLDDWLAAVFGWATLRYGTAMVPVVGQTANALANTFNHKPYDDRISTAPAISMVESAVSAPHSVYETIVNDKKPSKAIRDVATLVSMTTGVPVTLIAKPVGYWADVAHGDVRPTGGVDAVRGTLTGKASGPSKN